MKKTFRAVKPGTDRLVEEIAAVLLERAWFEFKPLFLVVHANLRQRKAAHGGEEMLRLRAWEKLQGLVRTGHVEKVGKLYRGKVVELNARAEHIAAMHCQELIDAVNRT
jgi:hypothetical protein